MKDTGFTVTQEDLRQEIPLVRAQLQRSGVGALMGELAPGPYGLTVLHLQALEVLENALAEALELRARLLHRIPDRDFTALFALYAAGMSGGSHLDSMTPDHVQTRGGFPASRLRRLLAQDDFAWALADDLYEFLSRHRDHPDPARRLREPHQVVNCLGAWMRLVANGAKELAADAPYEPFRKTLDSLHIESLGWSFRGFEGTATARQEEPGELLPVTADDIVGNGDYLKAAMRLARDVAGFDFERGENPKRLNPVLFAQGAPGCGKTVTAHAVGNYFLQYCKERDIPARFLVIRRTDWASSYQNASAQKLLDLFRQDVQGFPGVVGVYWPDIDTAFAARTEPGLRSEERNILGASFGVFDGTVIPKNGKWFLLCDANYMNMDEATLSRITQDPYRLQGPCTAEDFVDLMRDKKLKEFRDLLTLTDDEWLQAGRRCLEYGFSGRNVDSICRKIATEIQDVEPPEEYYKVGFEERKRILRSLAKPLDAQRLAGIMQSFHRFEQEAEKEAEQQRFQERVEEIRFHLRAQQEALRPPG